MVLGRRSFLRSLATAVVGVGIAPKIFLAQTEVIPIEQAPIVPVGWTKLSDLPRRPIDPELWGIQYWVTPANHGTYLGLDRSSVFNMKEPHGY